MRQRFFVVLVGTCTLVAAIAGAHALTGSTVRVPVASSVGEVEEGPADVTRIREAGGIGRRVTQAQIQRAAKQARALKATNADWTVLGPNNIGGRVTDLVVDPTQGNTIYIAAASGGVWKSTDAGSTFTTAWPDDSTQAIGALARGSDGTLWAGTGEANPSGGGITYFGDGLYRSIDGGAHWKQSGLEQSGAIGRIAVDPTNPKRIFVAASGSLYSSVADRGIYLSTNGGGSWTRVLAPPNDTTGGVDVAIDPSNPQHVFATLWDHRRTAYARTYGGVGSGLYVSNDGGQTWTRIDNSSVVGALPSYDAAQTGLNRDVSLGRMGVAFAPSDPTRVYVITGESFGADKGFFVSNDGGQTFTAGGKAGNNSRFEWWFGRLWVDPANKDHVFKADVSLRVSSDGGATWSNSNGPHADQHAMAWDPNVPGQVYLGDDGGVYRSAANGNSGWIHGTNMPFNQAYHADVAQDDPDRIVTGLQDNGSNRTWPAGGSPPPNPTIYNSYGGGDGHYVAIDPSDHTYYYSCSQNAGCSGTHDVNAVPTTLSAAAAAGATNVKLQSVTGLAAGGTLTIDTTGANPETVTITTVGTSGAGGTGVTFTPALAFAHAAGAAVTKNGVPGSVSLPFGSRGSGLRCTTDAPLVLDPTTPSTLYLGCNNLSRSTNRGATWTTIAPVDLLTGPEPADGEQDPLYAHQYPTISAIGVSKSDPNTIYAGTDNGRLWRTTDLGATWTELANPKLPQRWVTGIAVDPANADHAFVSFSGFRDGDSAANVFVTKTGGLAWKNVSGKLPNAPVNGIAYDQAHEVLYAASDLGVFFVKADHKKWKRLGDNLPAAPTEDVKLQRSDGLLYVATFGRGIWKIPLVTKP